jgi:hypothetical protein
MPVTPPFSRRASEPQPWIQDDWPKSARMALLHLLHDLVDRQYVSGWKAVDKEIRWIAREAPGEYSSSWDQATNDARQSVLALIIDLPWGKVFDLCERLYSPLAVAVYRPDSSEEHWIVETSREKAQQYIEDEVQRIFLEEHFAYSFEKGEVTRRGRSHTKDLMSKAEPTLGDPRLNEARAHYVKARRYFEDPSKPDYENAVKEAVCAVEAAARRLFPHTNAKTLGDLVKRIQGSGEGHLPKPLAETVTGLYAYRSAGDGVSHGGSDGGKVTPAIAEYVLAVTAAQVILLYEIARASETSAPF